MSFKECCEQAEKKLKASDRQPTDNAMCFITTALVYSVLAVACAIKENKKEE